MSLVNWLKDKCIAIRRKLHFFVLKLKQPYDCGLLFEAFEEITKRLEQAGFELNHLLQYIDEQQVLSGRKLFFEKNRLRQLHVRFYQTSFKETFKVTAHEEEIPELRPISHYLGRDVKNGCKRFWNYWSRTA